MQDTGQAAVKQEMTRNEEALVKRALAGDSDALDSLFDRDNRALYQTALRLLGNAQDAEDALQEGLLAAYRNLRRFQGRSKFSTWLTRIVINAALMRRRSQKSRPAISLDEWLTSEESVVPARTPRRCRTESGTNLLRPRNGRTPRGRAPDAVSGAAQGFSHARAARPERGRNRRSARRLAQRAEGAALARAAPAHRAPQDHAAIAVLRHGVRPGSLTRPRDWAARLPAACLPVGRVGTALRDAFSSVILGSRYGDAIASPRSFC